MPTRVILTEDIPTLGDAGEIVRVKDGYARNYLLPRGKAMLATEGRVKELEHQRRLVDERVKKEVGGWRKVADRMGGLELSFERHAGEEGKLFGSVTNVDIAAELKEWGFEVDRRKITLDDPIKAVGEYEIPVRLHREVQAQVKVKVIGTGGDEEADAAEPDEAEARMDAGDRGDEEEAEDAELDRD